MKWGMVEKRGQDMENNLEFHVKNFTFYPGGGGKPLKISSEGSNVVEFHFR